MNSLILFSLFFLLDFLFEIKADDIESDISCREHGNYYYYNSIKHKCQICNVKVYNNICYSSSNPKSVYGYGDLKYENCSDNEIMTELDDEGRYLGKLTCAATIQTLPSEYTAESVGKNSFSFKSFQNFRRPQDTPLTNSFTIREYVQDEINYSITACKEGLYEKSCQYLANLCVLDMYKENNEFCSIIFNFEQTK